MEKFTFITDKRKFKIVNHNGFKSKLTNSQRETIYNVLQKFSRGNERGLEFNAEIYVNELDKVMYLSLSMIVLDDFERLTEWIITNRGTVKETIKQSIDLRF